MFVEKNVFKRSILVWYTCWYKCKEWGGGLNRGTHFLFIFQMIEHNFLQKPRHNVVLDITDLKLMALISHLRHSGYLLLSVFVRRLCLVR